MSTWIFEPGEKASSHGDAIVAQRADRDHQIAIVHCIIGFINRVQEHAEQFCPTP
jgi:hypothetical protein